MSTYRLGVEDITGNALIEQMNSDPKKRFVSYSTIDKYGNCVANILRKHGDNVLISYWRVHVDMMLDRYCDFFDEVMFGGELGIQLKPEKTIVQLREQFRGPLALKVIQAFTDKKAIKCLDV